MGSGDQDVDSFGKSTIVLIGTFQPIKILIDKASLKYSLFRKIGRKNFMVWLQKGQQNESK